MYPWTHSDAATLSTSSRPADDCVFGPHNPRGGLIFNLRKSSMCGARPQMGSI